MSEKLYVQLPPSCGVCAQGGGCLALRRVGVVGVPNEVLDMSCQSLLGGGDPAGYFVAMCPISPVSCTPDVGDARDHPPGRRKQVCGLAVLGVGRGGCVGWCVVVR